MESVWKVKTSAIPGKSYASVNKVARSIFHIIEKRSKRKAYIKSKYFKKQKIFLSFFWDDLKSKKVQDRVRRLKLFDCAIELIQNSTLKPEIKTNPNNKQEIFFRFFGLVNDQRFVTQIKKDKKGRLELMSVYPK